MRLMRPFALVLLLGSFQACQDDAEPSAPERADGWAASDWTLVVAVDHDAVAAGDPVLLTATVTQPGGLDVTADYDVRIQWTPPLGVLSEGAGVYRFTHALPYTVFASVDVLGTTLVGTAHVLVSAGPATNLSVHAPVPLLEAGDTITMEAEITDDWGNPAVGTVSWGAAPTAEFHDADVTPEIAGHYVVTGILDENGASDSDEFSVVASIPISLQISLSSYDVEKGQGIIVTSDLRDAFGNSVDLPVDLSTLPASGTLAWADFVRFEQEGIFNVYADIPDFGLHDEDGPVLVDSTGPAIRVVSPGRGIEIPMDTNPTVTVEGSVSDAWTGVASVTVNGQPVVLQAGGLFEATITPQFGLNAIDIDTLDGDGNHSDYYGTFLWGDFLPMGDENTDGILARLNEPAIDTLEAFAEGFFDPQALVAGIVNQPLWSNSQQTCINIWPFGNQCVTWWDIHVGVTGATLGDLDIDLDAQAGYLDFFGSISPFSVSLGLWGEILFFGNVSVGGTAAANQAQIWSDVSIWVDSAHDIQVALSNTSVALPGFGVSIYGAGFVGDVLNAVLGWISPILQVAFEAVLPPVIEGQLPGLIQSALGDLEIATTIPLLGTSIDLEALPYAITIDPNGMTVDLSTIVETLPAVTAPATLGALRRPGGSLPVYAPSPAFDISMADNFVNQLLHAVWQSGALTMTMDSNSLGLDLSAISSVVPITTLSFQTNPMLPPVVGPGTGGLLQLALGDLLVDLSGDPGGNPGLMMELAVSVTADATLSIAADNTIAFEVGDPQIVMEYVTSDWSTVDGETAENLMDAVVDLIVPLLIEQLDTISGIPIPALPGFELQGPSIWRESAPAYYMTAGGNLVVIP